MALLTIVSVLLSAVTIQPPQTHFLRGEVDTLVGLRNPEGACQTLQNCQVIGAGSVTRRPGTVYVADTDGDAAACLYPFVYNESDAYILEFTDSAIHFFRDDGQILSGASPYELATDFTSDEIFELQMAQSADVMYIAHPDHWPQELIRSGHASWTIGAANITNGPFLDENETTTTLTADATTGAVTVTASANTFNANHAGSYWQISHVLDSQRINGTFTGTANSSSVVIGQGAVYAWYLDDAAWQGTIEVQYSLDDGVTWDALEVLNNATAIALDEEGGESSDYNQNALLRVSCTAFTSGSADYVVDVNSYTHRGVVYLDTYTSETEMSGTVMDRLGETGATTYWAEGAWSDDEGYPDAVTIVGNRLVFAKGLTLYFSAAGTAYYEDFYNDTDDDDAFTYELSSGRQNPIRWLYGQSNTKLIAGSLGRVFEIEPALPSAGFLPTNPPTVTSSANVAVKKRQPAVAGSTVLFIDRIGENIHEIVYDYDQSRIIGPSLTYLASHMGGTGFQQIAFQQTPYPTLWCVRDDGWMASLYYDRAYQVAAWSKHNTDGEFTSVAVIPNDGAQDRVWVVAKREIGGSDVYMVEYIDDMDTDAELQDFYYLDSGARFDGGAAVNISGITKADPGVVTVASWPTGLSDGTNVQIEDVSGMTEINNRVFIVDDASEVGLTFSLDSVGNSDWDTSGYTAYTSGGTVTIVENSFANLDHLEAESLAVWADGSVLANETVASGAIVIDVYSNTVAVGMPFTTIIEPLRANYASEAQSTAYLPKRIIGLVGDFYYTSGGYYGLTDDTNPERFEWPIDSTTNRREQFNGSLVTPSFGGTHLDLSYRVTSEDEYPLTVRSLVPIVEMR